jgi:hypothetical protein
MPILDDIMDHDVLGPVLRQGREEGREEGRKEGLKEGEEAARIIIRRLLEQRFGIVPAWVAPRLASLSAPDLVRLSDRIPEASDIKDLFPNSK